MGFMDISLRKIIENKQTYPSWSCNAVYSIRCAPLNKNELLVYYEPGAIPRRVSRVFPRFVKADPVFLWVLGFLKGEGANSKGKSNYRRFTLTNKDPALISLCLDELHNKKLLDKNAFPDASLHIIHATDKKGPLNYWSRQLLLPLSKFKYFKDSRQTSQFGVCHVYFSDVLLRRVVDELSNHILALNKK